MTLSRRSHAVQTAIIVILPFVLTLLVRLPMVGGPPEIDECMYAVRCALFAEGGTATEYSPIDLYPWIARALAGMPNEVPLLHLRVFDAFVSAAASSALALFLLRWAGFWPALAMAVGWSVAANDPRYAQYGFRNSIMAATLVVAICLNLLSTGKRWPCLLAGLIIPVAPLLREQFFLVPIATLYLAAALRGRKGLLEHLAGLVLGTLLQLAWIIPFRGSPRVILGLYRDRGMAIRREGFMVGFDQWVELKRSLGVFLDHSAWMLVPAILGVVCLVPARTSRNLRLRMLTGLAILLPVTHLYEIFAMADKKVLPYHWAQLLFVAAFLGALGLSEVTKLARAKRVAWVTRRLYVGLALVCLLVGVRPMLRKYRDAWRLSKHYAPVMVKGHWDGPPVHESHFLALARYLREHAKPTDRAVVLGHHPLTAYALGRLRPLSPEIIDLNRFQRIKYYERRPDLVQLLRDSPPDIVVEEYGVHYINEPDLRQAWPDFDERFTLVHTIPPDPSAFYGYVGERIYRRR